MRRYINSRDSMPQYWMNLCLKMFVKIATITLTAFIAITASADQDGETIWDGSVVSWDLDTSTHFYNFPKTLEEAEDEGWTDVTGVNPPEGVTAVGYYGDPTFVLLFKEGVFVGFQIAIPVDEISPEQPMKWDELDAIITKTLNGELYYTATIYVYSDESQGLRKIWFQEKNEVREIPTSVFFLTASTEFLLGKCVPTQGTFYLTWKSTSDCATLNPWFLLGVDDNIVGVGIHGFGTLSTRGVRTWWETIPANGIYAAISDPPACAVDALEKFGTISLHVWFVDEPQDITCS